MKPGPGTAASLLADRREAVRAAFRRWKAPDGIRARVAELHPDDRLRVGPVFRALLFGFTSVAVLGTAGFLTAVFDADSIVGVLILITSAGLGVATDRLVHRGRRRHAGIEEATAFLFAVFGAVGTAWLAWEWGGLRDRVPLAFAIVLAALLAISAWRWLYPVHAALAVAFAGLALTTIPGGRWLWILLPLLLLPLLARRVDAPEIPPSRRTGLEAVGLSALVLLYLALHVSSVEDRWIERLGGFLGTSSERAVPIPVPVAAIATAVLPLAVLGLGIRLRRRTLLWLGGLTITASLVTLRTYVRIADLWVVLTGSGLLLLALTTLVRRFLDAGPGGERAGFTARPIEREPGGLGLVELGAAVAFATPESRERPPDAGGFEGGGGRSGGAGATGDW